MKKGILRLALVMLLLQFVVPPPVQAYRAVNNIKADQLKGWLNENKIEVTADDSGTSWRFVLICPPAYAKEFQWGCLLQLGNTVAGVGDVAVKPRIFAKGERRVAEGSIAFEFTFSKELLENSVVWMYLEEKIPSSVFSEPHIYDSIKLKDLLAAVGQRKP